MFSITLPKLLLFVIVVGAVWWWHRRNQVRAREKAELDRDPRPGAKHKPVKPIEDMAQCKVCGAYVAAKGASRCGRDNCPF
jgi:ribosomal protein L44E